MKIKNKNEISTLCSYKGIDRTHVRIWVAVNGKCMALSKHTNRQRHVGLQNYSIQVSDLRCPVRSASAESRPTVFF